MKLFCLFFLFFCFLVFPVLAKRKPRHLPHYNDVRFTCAGDRFIEARFLLDEPGRVQLRLSDGRTMQLPHALAASGARYANKDETVIFWTKGDGAFIVEQEILTYRDCTSLKGP